MIDYFKGVNGVNLLGRVHGSALYRGSFAGLLAVLVFLVIEVRRNRRDDDAVDHPYGVGVLIASVTFLIVFRANYGYQRYWEACVSADAALGGSFCLIRACCRYAGRGGWRQCIPPSQSLSPRE